MEQAVDRLLRRVRLMVASGATTAPPDDSGAVQTVQVQVSPDEVIDRVPVLALFGHDAALPVGSQVVVLFMGGDRSQGVVIGSGSPPSRKRSRKAGETGLHNAFGMALAMLEAGVVLDGGGKDVTVVGNLRVTGDVLALSGGASVSLSQHKHADPQGGETTKPVSDASGPKGGESL